jgi:hypothetical protein
MRVHLSKCTAHFIGNGGKIPQVFDQEGKIQNDEHDRGKDESRMISPGYEDGHE